MPALRKQFVNLHNHTVGSLLDGISKMDIYAQRAIELNQPAVCATDHGNLYSLIDNYKAAQKAGIPYLVGIEAYMARKSRWDQDGEEKSGPASSEWEQRGPYHQTIIAVNNTGYHNLLRLSSDSFGEGFLAGKGRVDKELISKYSEGLVVLSGCMSSEVSQALMRDDFKFALQSAAAMQEIVGKENYFIEIMNHGIPEETALHSGLIEISERLGAPIIPTCDSHFTHKHDAVFHDIALCIATGSRINTPNRFKFSGEGFYLKSYDEMCELFPAEWVENSLLVSDKLDLNIKFGESHYPVFRLPKEHNQLTISEYFVREIASGAERRFGPNWKTERRDVADRLNEEVSVIQSMGYDSYFLIVADIIHWAANRGILTGCGRGSSASSLVSYCMGITHIDPLEYDLLFERFLTPGRIPDIDVDVDDRYRDQVIDYIRTKYGHEHTAQILTMSKLRAKSVVNDVSRVLDHPFEFAQEITSLMPPPAFGVPKTLTECLETTEFKNNYDTNEEVKQVIDIALELEDLWRTDGIHAGGIIIADKPIKEYCPTQQKGEDKPVVTQWDMRTTEDIGLLKMDILGLINLNIIDHTIQNIKSKEGIDLGHPWDIARNPDPAVFKYLSRGKTGLVFQMGSDGLTAMVKDMGIGSMKDIMAAIALYRPGPMGSGFHVAYAKRKKGRQKATPLHPLLEENLKDTYGLLIYQESVMAIAKDIAGFDPTQANKFLKSIGKKDKEAMIATRESFVQGCIDTSGISKKEAEDLFAAIEPHSSYSFNASHAIVYAYIAYITAHLACHYPTYYAAACLSSVMFGAEEKFRPVLNDVVDKLKVKVVSPSVNKSQFDFDSDGKNVIFSISGLKRIGNKKSTPFVDYRNETNVPYENIYQFFREANVGILDKTFVEALIHSGSLDELVQKEQCADIQIGIEEHLNALLLEQQTLGVCITENPFEIYYQNIKFDKTTYPATKMLEGVRGNHQFCGVVRDPEFKVSKAGRRFIKLKLDDGIGIVDCLVSGRTIEKIENSLGKLEDVITPGAFIVYNGIAKLDRADEEGETHTIFVSDITSAHTPQTMGDLINSITLRIENEEDLTAIAGIAYTYPGNKKVYTMQKHPDADIMLRTLSGYKVNDKAEKYLQKYIEV